MTIAWTGLDGKPQGTVKYVADYGQPYTEDQQNGHFFPIAFRPEYYDKDILVGSQNGEGGKTIRPTAKDPYLIIRVENVTVDKKISAIVSETQEKVFELDFTDTTLQENPMVVSAAAIARGTVSADFIATRKYDAADLKQLTVSDIKRIASERGYTINATKKDAIIVEFLAQQESDAE